MTVGRPFVGLCEVMALSDRGEPVAKLGQINLAGVYSFGRGLFQRGPVDPSETSYKTYNRLVSGDFVISQPKAWEGALALVPPGFDGWYLSPVFPTFQIDTKRLLPEYLSWFCKRSSVWFELQRKSRGIGARRETVSPETFLSLQIPLPPLSEQQRIVARLEAIAGKVEEAKRLREEAGEESTSLLIAMAHRRDLSDAAKRSRGWVKRKLIECIQLREEPFTVDVSKSYPNLGIYSFGRGLFAKPPIAGLETSASRLFRVKKGQFIYSRLFAFEGAYGVVTDEFDGCFVSNEYPAFDCVSDRIRPAFLAAYFQTPAVWRAVEVGSKGLGDRRQRVHPEQVLRHELWVPPVSYQETLTSAAQHTTEIRTTRADSLAAVDVLLPSVLDRAFRGEL